MSASLAVVGFPKCGTSALMRELDKDANVDLVLNNAGGLELGWPAIQKIENSSKKPAKNRVSVHKFTAYIYNEKALTYLADSKPERKFVLCIRDPLKALISWQNMHQNIARSGKNPEHFAWKERDFYSECSISDYYERFARDRLQYDRHIEQMINIVEPNRILVIGQEKMAGNTALAARICLDFARGVAPVPETPVTEGETHIGYADRTQIPVEKDIAEELKAVSSRMNSVILNSGVHRFL